MVWQSAPDHPSAGDIPLYYCNVGFLPAGNDAGGVGSAAPLRIRRRRDHDHSVDSADDDFCGLGMAIGLCVRETHCAGK